MSMKITSLNIRGLDSIKKKGDEGSVMQRSS